MPPYLTKRMLAERYGVTKRTIERMWADGRLPPPVYPLGPQRPYNDLEKIEAAERAAVALAGAALRGRSVRIRKASCVKATRAPAEPARSIL